jgi:glycosyltransferase involved in cell wall biosynthesis
MKILMLFPYAPLPPPLDLAGTKRNLPFFLELARRHEVSVLSFGTPAEEAMFRQSYGHLCGDVRFVNRKRPRLFSALQLLWLLVRGRSPFRMLYRSSMQQAINELTAARQFDVIHCCVQMFGYFKFPAGVPVTSDTHEVTYDLLRRTAERMRPGFSRSYRYLCYRLGKPEEIRLCRKFDLLIATTGRDLSVFRENLPAQNMTVIQNGAGATFFEDLAIAPEPFTLTFTGLFTHLPNLQGVLWFLDDVFPQILRLAPAARIYIVGKSPPRELLARASENVIVTGFVDDVRPYIARAQVFVIPLLAGGGIRGKALEVMAMKRPIVTTTIGVEGILLRPEESALFADSAEAFARQVLRLFADGSVRAKLADKAFTIVVRDYTWVAKGQELHQALSAIVDTCRRRLPVVKRALQSVARSAPL